MQFRRQISHSYLVIPHSHKHSKALYEQLVRAIFVDCVSVFVYCVLSHFTFKTRELYTGDEVTHVHHS